MILAFAFLASLPSAVSAQSGKVGAAFDREARAIVVLKDAQERLARIEKLAARDGLTEIEEVVAESLRATTLASLGRNAEVVAAVEKLVAKYPRSAPTRLAEAQVAFYQNDYAKSARSIILASEIDPAVVNMIPVYELTIIFSWLKSQDRRAQSTALARRLFDAGWNNGSARFRSMLALDVIEENLTRGEFASAGRYVPMITDPATFARILSERSFAPVRPAARDWAGARLEKQWPIYLERTRSAWLQTRGPETAADYAAALEAAGHYRTLVDTFMPRFSRPLDPDRDMLWIFVAGPVARALAAQDRWEEAFAFLDRASKVWPPSFGANAINIDAARAQLRLNKGDYATAARLFEALIIQADAAENQVTPQTRATIEVYRLCALHRAKQKDVGGEAQALAAQWANRKPDTLAWLQLCLGKRDRALATWTAAVANPLVRTDAVRYIQPRSTLGPNSAFVREMRAAEIDLSNDPALRAAIRPFGDRLAFTISERAPAEAPAQSR